MDQLRLPIWIIKLIFHLLYYQMAWTYDFVAWSVSFGQWAAWRRLVLPFLHSGKTLELAYGTGGLFVDMLEAGHDPVGIDLSPFMARIASRRLRRNHSTYRLSRAQAQAIPFASNYFDNVVATFPSDYMLEPETLQEIHRVLKPQVSPDETYKQTGRLVIVAIGELRGPWPIRPFIDWLYRVTDQKSMPPSKPLSLLQAHHFSARWERIEKDGAIAQLLIADKEVNS